MVFLIVMAASSRSGESLRAVVCVPARLRLVPGFSLYVGCSCCTISVQPEYFRGLPFRPGFASLEWLAEHVGRRTRRPPRLRLVPTVLLSVTDGVTTLHAEPTDPGVAAAVSPELDTHLPNVRLCRDVQGVDPETPIGPHRDWRWWLLWKSLPLYLFPDRPPRILPPASADQGAAPLRGEQSEGGFSDLGEIKQAAARPASMTSRQKRLILSDGSLQRNLADATQEAAIGMSQQTGNHPIAVLREPHWSGNHRARVSVFTPATFLSQARHVTSKPFCAVQAYVKSKGNMPTVYRVLWRRKGAVTAFAISHTTPYDLPPVRSSFSSLLLVGNLCRGSNSFL